MEMALACPTSHARGSPRPLGPSRTSRMVLPSPGHGLGFLPATLLQDPNVLARMALCRRHEARGAVMVPVVVPLDELLAPLKRLFEAREPPRVKRAGLEA